MKRKILLSMLAVMTSICMMTACGNSSNSVQDTKSMDETESGSTVQDEEKQTTEEVDADGISRNVAYRSDEFYLSIGLPTDWEYQILSEEDLEKEDNLYSCAIRFWQKDYPEDIFVLGYQPSFGMCGTGVTIDELKLENGITGWRYTEELDSSLWLTITLNNPENDVSGGTYLITASPSLEDWKVLEPAFEEILQTVWVGPKNGEEELLKGTAEDLLEEGADVPSKETVLERRNACLQGMSEEDITRLTENIKVANLAMEYSYLYDRLFERMADPEDLYWNYVDQKGDIQIGYSLEQEAVDAWKEYSQNAEEITDMDSYWKAYQQYEEEHGQPVYTYNRFDADNFIALMEEMKGLLKNDTLAADLDQLIENTRQAKETHDVTYIKEIYYILHDMDYYLLRYAPDDVASFVQDKGRIAVYYGALQVYG
ncbi:MAG: hypothetical protein MR817_01690 [Lachnospiraceae bacterium]|nr:hypothetical protein [Lachnospiraceae bacterium]